LGKKNVNQPKTTDRGIALLKFTLDLLKGHADGLRPQDIFREIQARVPLDSFDTDNERFRLTSLACRTSLFSVAASRAGYLTKSDGWWRITDEGQNGALLDGMGYTTRFVASPGPDGGTDALAYVDPLGARTPHIRVQVKHRDQPAGREEITEASLASLLVAPLKTKRGYLKDAATRPPALRVTY
jgi:hypothetical protein